MRALVLAGDPWHPAGQVMRGLEALAAAEFEFCEAGAGRLPPELEKFGLVVLAKANVTSTTNLEPWLKPDGQPQFVAFVRSGGGLLVIHAGTSRYEWLPAMNGLIGGAFLRHPDQCAVTVEPKNGHGLTLGVKTFLAPDEHYFVSLNDDHAEIILQARSEHGIQPAGWVRTEGAGRVCVLTPGHSAGVWRHPEYQKLLRNALRWTAKLD